MQRRSSYFRLLMVVAACFLILVGAVFILLNFEVYWGILSTISGGSLALVALCFPVKEN